jgi:eukaryotic-like serine/threonine-protein kinase
VLASSAVAELERILADAAPPSGVTEDLVAARLRVAVFGPAPELVTPHHRYTLLERLGQGGMGTVWAAWDAKLDRKIALKFLRSGEHARLLAEAQALARLSDPHVVAVFDVASWSPPDEPDREHVVLAMEFLAGQTLQAWLRAAPRSWRAIVAMFVQTGRGLAAAHRASVIHRDFKPENVIVGANERAKVVDFGLARVQHGEPTDPGARNDHARADEGSLAFAGTPPFMPPEQHRGDAVDARADQYAWCVALWEALHRERPFRGDDLASLLHDKLEHAPRTGGVAVPGWIRRALERGLSPDPARRWPDMDALLRELDRDPARRRRQIAAGVVLTCGVAAVAIAWPRADPCDQGAAIVGEVWNGERASAIENAFTGLALPYAATTWATARGELDEYAAAWAGSRDEACVARRRRDESDELFDRRMACLAGRRDRLRALLDVLASADATTVDRAVTAVEKLPGIERCSDVVALRSELAPPDDPAAVELVGAVEHTLADARAEIDAGHFDRGLAHAEIAIAEWRSGGVDHEATLADAELVRGDALGWVGRSEDARASLVRSAAAALRAGADETFAHAAAGMVWELGDYARDFDGAAQWSELGEAALARAGRPPEIAYLLGNAIAIADLAAERIDPARDRLVRELAAVEAHFGPHDHRAFVLRTNLGNVLLRGGRREEARDEYQRAIDIGVATLGDEHPRVLLARSNLVASLRLLGRDGAAREEIERVLAAQLRTVGAQHPDYANSLVLHASVCNDLGEYPLALADCDEAAPTIAATMPRTHLDANLHVVRARALLRLGRLDEADGDVKAAASIMASIYRETNSDQAYVEELVGDLAMAREDSRAAEQAFTRMLDIVRTTDGDAIKRGGALLRLAGSLRAQHRMHEALAYATLAIVELAPAGGSGRRDLEKAYDELATIVAALGRDDEALRSLAVATRAQLAE